MSTTGTSRLRSRTARSSWMPVMPGIEMSLMMVSKSWPSSDMASRPSCAGWTSQPGVVENTADDAQDGFVIFDHEHLTGLHLCRGHEVHHPPKIGYYSIQLSFSMFC